MHNFTIWHYYESACICALSVISGFSFVIISQCICKRLRSTEAHSFWLIQIIVSRHFLCNVFKETSEVISNHLMKLQYGTTGPQFRFW